MAKKKEDGAKSKRAVYEGLAAVAGAGAKEMKKALGAVYHKDAQWRGSHPINEVEGLDAICSSVWVPLTTAMPDLERRDSILIGGEYEGRYYVGAVGHLLGTFRRPWLGIAPTGQATYLRYGEYHHVEGGKIRQSTVIFDVLDFIRQCGIWPLAPMMGSDAMWPGPISGDGIVLDGQDPKESKRSIELVLAMHKTINEYKDTPETGREDLLQMEQKKYWHPKMMWHGPAGIGAARGLEGFVDVHQLPFRKAFPNREAVGHYVRFGDGKYAATGGWPSLRGRHAGGDFMGLPATGREFSARVMDFYLNEGDLIRENWVPIDMIHLLDQLGLSVFARLHERGVGMLDRRRSKRAKRSHLGGHKSMRRKI